MGFLHDIFTAGPALNRLAKTCDECLNCIYRYKLNNDFDEIIKCTWLFRYGVLDSLEKWNWNPMSAKICIPNHMELGRIPVNQAILIILNFISRIVDEDEESDIIKDILAKGECFYEYDYLCSVEMKNKLKP
jgi:hypothetical protein